MVEVADITHLVTRAIAARRKSRHSLLNAVLKKENHAQIQGSKNRTLALEMSLVFGMLLSKKVPILFDSLIENQENSLSCVYELALWNISGAVKRPHTGV